jgi:hypothetical protein
MGADFYKDSSTGHSPGGVYLRTMASRRRAAEKVFTRHT